MCRHGIARWDDASSPTGAFPLGDTLYEVMHPDCRNLTLLPAA
jgi:hypothetical protein